MSIRQFLISARQAVRKIVQTGIRTRSAIGISVIIHLIVAAAFASFFVQAISIHPPDEPASIEFDLVSQQRDISIPSQTDQSLTDNIGMTENSSESAGKTGTTNVSSVNRRAVVLASLATLSDLSYTFGFVNEDVSTDSLTSSLIPVHGDAPASDYNSFGLKNGEGYGNRGGIIISGGGVCVAPPGR